MLRDSPENVGEEHRNVLANTDNHGTRLVVLNSFVVELSGSAAARSAVRCNRLLGVPALLAPEHNMGGPFRRHELDAFVSQGPQVNGIEQPLASTEQDRRDCDMHLIDTASTKILLDGVGSAANTDVHPFRC